VIDSTYPVVALRLPPAIVCDPFGMKMFDSVRLMNQMDWEIAA
jgi:hypothetical protein